MAKKGKVKKALTIAGFIFKVIWLVFALIIFFCGLSMFRSHPDFTNWMIWGALCLFPILGEVIRSVIVDTRRGAVKGSHHYTATVDNYGVTVSNNTFKEAIISFVASIIASIIAGPIYLGFKILAAVVYVVSFSIGYFSAKKAQTTDNTEVK